MASTNPGDEAVTIRELITGSDAGTELPGCYHIWNPAEYVQAWAKYSTNPLDPGSDPRINVAPDLQFMPNVDFRKEMVVAIFGGQTTGTKGFGLIDARVKNHRILVRFAPEADGTNPSSRVLEKPYAFLIMNRLRLPMDVEVQIGELNGLPFFKPIVTFSKPDTD